MTYVCTSYGAKWLYPLLFLLNVQTIRHFNMVNTLDAVESR